MGLDGTGPDTAVWYGTERGTPNHTIKNKNHRGGKTSQTTTKSMKKTITVGDGVAEAEEAGVGLGESTS